MQNSTLYPTVYVLGNGQLGRMLRYAGAPLDIHVQPLEFNAPVFDLPKDANPSPPASSASTTANKDILSLRSEDS